MVGKRGAVIRSQGEHACQLDFPEYFRSNYLGAESVDPIAQLSILFI